MAGRAEHTADKQPGRRKRAARAGGSNAGGDATSPSRASIPELPAVSMDAVGAAVLVCAADGTIVDLNRAAAQILGVDPAKARGAGLREVQQWAGTWVTESGETVGPDASAIAGLAFTGRRVEGEVAGLTAPAARPPSGCASRPSRCSRRPANSRTWS